MHKKIYTVLFLVPFLFAFQCSKDDNPEFLAGENITDIDGNVYNTIIIGNQTWMLENLKTTKLNDGTPITEYEHFNNPSFPWSNDIAMFQWPFTGDLNNIYPQDLPFDYYGAQYNHIAIQSGKLNIDGWRIPTEQDYIELKNFIASLGHSGIEAKVLKSAIGWIQNEFNGTDLFGFDVRPAGMTIIGGTPDLSESIAVLATSDINTSNNTRVTASFFESNDEIQFEDLDNRNGFSIRLIKE